MRIHSIEPYLNEGNLKNVLEFVFETEIKKQTSIYTYRTARIDYSFELPHNKQSVFVEFNGSRHYTLTDNIQRDYMVRCYVNKNNIRLVEIPYFVQLDNYTIPQYFGLDTEQYLENKEVTTPIESGFHEKKIVLPWDFCITGLERFAKDISPISHVINSNNKDDTEARFYRTPKQIWKSLYARPDNDKFNMQIFLESLNSLHFSSIIDDFFEMNPQK